jgi:hypothetical protein
MPWPLDPQKKEIRFPVNRRLGVPQSQSGRFGEEKKILSVPGSKPRIIQFETQNRYRDTTRILAVFTVTLFVD